MSKNGKNGKHIVQRNGKEISVYQGQYSTLATMELMQWYPNRLITVEELSFLHYGKVNVALMQLVRQQMWRAPNKFLDDGVLSFIQYQDDWPHQIVGIKIYNARTDKKHFGIWHQNVKDRKEFTDAKLAIIDDLLKE